MKVLKHVMAVCLLLIVLVLVSCSDEHTHTYGEWDETRAPTCLELGRRVRACTECGEEEIDFLPLAPHKLGEYIPAVESLRCDEPGTVAHYICEICGKKTDASGVEITDTTYYMSHSYLPWEIGANNTKTCVGASFISECEVCGHVRQRFGTEEDHNLEHSVIPATCTESAVKVTDCLNCQYRIEEPVGAPIGHSEVTYYGISNSYHHDICSVCDNAVGERIEHTDRGDGSCSVCAGVIGPSEGIQYVLTSFSGSDEKLYMLLKYEGTLKNVIVPSELEGIPVVAIGDRAFIGNKEMESLILPDTVSQIRYEAFSGCSSLKTVRLPKSVSRIYGEAFKDCTSLSELDLGDSLTLIDDSAFSGCTALECVTMPSTLSKIGEKAF